MRSIPASWSPARSPWPRRGSPSITRRRSCCSRSCSAWRSTSCMRKAAASPASSLHRDRCCGSASACSACASRSSQIASLGPWPVATVIVGVATTILFGFLLARRTGSVVDVRRPFGRRGRDLRRFGGARDRLRPAAQRHTGARHHPHRGQRHRAVDDRDDHLSRSSQPRSASTTDRPAFSSAARSMMSRRSSAPATRFRTKPATSRLTSSCCASRCCCPPCSQFRFSYARNKAATARGARATLPMFLVGFAVLVVINSIGLLAAGRDRSRQRRVALVSGRGDRGASA